MRPRKKVLLYGADEQTLATTAFALGLRDFTVLTASDECDFVRSFEAASPDAVVFFLGVPSDELRHFVRRTAPGTTTLRAKRSNIDLAELRWALETAVRYKRGAKKRAASVLPAEIEAVSA